MMTTESTRRITCGLTLIAAGTLAGCSSDRLFGSGDQPPPTARAAPQTLPVDMAGRWRLATPSGGACGMVFGGTPGASDGTIAPEGGCPENFYTSRRWAFDQGALLIRDHTGKTLAELRTKQESFEGQTAGGQLIWLAR
jgi:hypothetical protein